MASVTSYNKAKLDALLAAKADSSALSSKADSTDLTTHTANTGNPHSVTKSQVGLGNVDNTSDAAKPVSTAQQAALNLKANSASLAAVATSGAYSDLSGAPDTSQMLTLDNVTRMLNTPWNPILPAWNGDTDAPSAMSGMTQTAGVFKASVDGTMGRAVIPILNTLMGDCRVSFRVKVNKSLANGRRMTVGFAEGTPGTATSGSDKTWESGFMNKNSGGTNMGMIRIQDNVWGAENFTGTGVSYADLTDSGLYDVSLHYARIGAAQAGSAHSQLGVRITNVTSGVVVYQQSMIDRTLTPANIVISSNTNVGEISNVRVAMHPLGEAGAPSYNRIKYTTQSHANEVAGLLIPAKPNGRLVFCFHGMNETDRYWAAASGESPQAGFVNMTEALVAAGYTVAIPLMRGSFSSQNTFGNLTAQECVKDLYKLLVNQYGLHPRVHLVGNSAGGMVSWIMAETRPFPIASMYQAEAASDFVGAWTHWLYGGGIQAAWNTDVALRDQYNPNARPASDFAGIPIYMIASSGDGTVDKGANQDAMNTKLNGLGAAKSHWALSATGNHGDVSHFRPVDLLTLVRANP